MKSKIVQFSSKKAEKKVREGKFILAKDKLQYSHAEKTVVRSIKANLKDVYKVYQKGDPSEYHLA